jgi:hypothetical protein
MQYLIKEIYFNRIGEKTTVCCLKLKNGFEVIGTSACVNPKDFDVELGEKYAYEAAIIKLEELEGFHRQQILFTAEMKVTSPEKQIDDLYEEIFQRVLKAMNQQGGKS